jgi:hypothetical protein
MTWAQARQVPLYVGEWGTRSGFVGYEQYIRDRFALFTAWNVHYAYFVWRSDAGNFGIFPTTGALKAHNSAVLDALRSALSGTVRPDFAAEAR